MPIAKNSIKVQVTLKDNTAEKLDIYCKNNGISRTAAISLAINNLIKEEAYHDKQ